MKIVVVGTRGIPDILGGVETHCEQLYPRLAAMGHDVTIIRRTPYITDKNRVSEYRGVRLIDVYAPRKKSFEAIVHTFLAVTRARALHPDILHIHAIGPAIMAPWARLLGMKTVMTNHGPDYDRQKWNALAKAVLRTGERWGTRWANKVIVISKVIADILARNYGRTDTALIYNGVECPQKASSTGYVTSLGLEPGKYVVAMGRFVKEKGFHDLIGAWKRVKAPGFKLAIAGDADHPDAYSRQLKEMARDNGVVLTGFIKGVPLNELMSHAALFAMPSYHEGLPIALLEAMSYDLDVVVSDIPANCIPELDKGDFFPVGNIEALAQAIESKLVAARTPRQYDLSAYDWDVIARSTLQLYKELL